MLAMLVILLQADDMLDLFSLGIKDSCQVLLTWHCKYNTMINQCSIWFLSV